MLDPLTAIGLAGNIVQLVDFCTKVVSKANRIYRSADGSLAENFDAETVSRDLLYLTARIEAGSRPSLASDEEHALEDLCTGCNDVAQELLAVLGSLRSGNKLGRWKSFKQALKNVWSKDRIEVLQTRLAGFREELDLHVLIDLSQKLDLQSVARSDGFKTLEESTRNVIDAVLHNRSAFTVAIQEQTAEIVTTVAEQHGKTRTQIASTAESLDGRNTHQHEKTREELAHMTMEAGMLRREMEQQLAEIKELITATGQAQGQIQHMNFEEKANKASASWIVKDLAFTEIMAVITGTHPVSPSHAERKAPGKGANSNLIIRANEGLSKSHSKGGTPSQSPDIGESLVNLNKPSGPPFKNDISRPDFTHYFQNSRTKERYERLTYINKFRSMGFFGDPDKLPKSFRIAVNNRFTRRQIEDIYADLRLAFSHTRPFFFVGAYIFPSTVRLKTRGTSLRSIAKNMTPAIIRGYNRHAVYGADWPALAPSIHETDFVKGMAVFGLHDSQRMRIHEFQGDMFDLKKETVEIELDDGSSMELEACVYVWNQDGRLLVPVEWATWSPEDFLQSEFYDLVTDAIREEEVALERT